MMKYIKKRLGLFLYLVSFLAWSQSTTKSTVTGIIKDSDGPLSFVNISLKGTTYGTVADEDGRYKLIAPAGDYTLLVSYLGYTSQEERISLKQGLLTTKNFVLKEASTNLDEVMVVGQSKSQRLREEGLTVNAIELKELSNVSLNMSEVLNKSTGVKVRQTGGVGSDFTFSINGLSGKAVKFFIDGIPLEVMGSSMSLNNIPVNIAERVVVYKGVVPVHLGADALGGAVNIITSQSVSSYLDASYSVGSFNTHKASVSGQYKQKKTGLTAKASTFINYSDNSYVMNDVQVIEVIDKDNSRFVTGDFERFHDQYKSFIGQLEVGVTNKEWADLFFVGASYSETDKEIQTGNYQEVVYGAVNKTGSAYSTSLRFLKKDLFTDQLDFNFYTSISEDKYQINDTVYRNYYWDGFYLDTPNTEMGRPSIYHIKRPKTYTRANFSYTLDPINSFGLNYTLDRVKNYIWNALEDPKDYNPGELAKHNLGLSYQQDLMGGKLLNSFFVKYYGLGLDQGYVVTDPNSGETETVSDWDDSFGYGVGSRYNLTENLGIKASYEKAYRLQEVGELFGNGYTVISNTELLPESSDNINFGLFYKTVQQKSRLFVESGAYLRNAKDFISLVAYQSNDQVFRYENTSKVIVKGFDADVKYGYGDFLDVNLNMTYQSTINNTKYAEGQSSGTYEATYKNELPNRPQLFGNATLALTKENIFHTEGTKLSFNWDMQYVHWYYLTWANYGVKESLNTIPDQYIQNASLSYSIKNGMYNISLECRNLLNEMAYDNFKLQKPGRSFALKLRYFIK